MEPLNILLDWGRIHPHLHPQIAAVDPRIRLHWGTPLLTDDPEYRRMLGEAEILFGLYRLNGLENEAPRLRWFQSIAAGIDWYWKSPMAKQDIVVCTASGVGGHSIAEYVIMAVMMLLKQVPERLRLQHEHRWQRVVVSELRGRTVLVIGLGGIGDPVARLAKAFETTVLATRRNWQAQPTPYVDELHPPQALRDLLPRADVVVLSAALVPETRHMIGEAELALMKPSAIFVNVGRGPHVDQPALERALAQKQIAGAFLDVFDPEPLPADSPLWDMPNVIISPHNTVANDVYDQNLVRFFCEQLRRYLDGQLLQNVADRERGY